MLNAANESSDLGDKSGRRHPLQGKGAGALPPTGSRHPIANPKRAQAERNQRTRPWKKRGEWLPAGEIKYTGPMYSSDDQGGEGSSSAPAGEGWLEAPLGSGSSPCTVPGALWVGGEAWPGPPGPALGVGSTAGAAAGFAVVPVAAQVHLDGQSAVGSRLVLAAVVCGAGRLVRGEKKKGKSH